MTRELIVFGNGLGRALNNEYFSIEKAMSSVWENSGCLDSAAKTLISACLPNDKDTPTSEDDLKEMYYAIISCGILGEIGGRCEDQCHFLSDEGRNFIKTVKVYVTKIASYFYRHKDKLPESFTVPLVKFINDTNSHVATLNYDDLLYTCFKDSEIFGQKGDVFGTAKLLDGVTDAGFDKKNLERKYGRTFGWYLHLHGSPLFRTKGKKVIKIGRDKLHEDLENDLCNYSDHIVLSHVDHKRDYIMQSDILSVYWEYFDEAIEEVNRITFFGYGGGDLHLNSIIKKKNVKVRVVKRKSNNERDEEEYWEDLFGEGVEIIALDNILNFTAW